MRRLLITGKNGYIAQKFAQFLREFPDEYDETLISLRDSGWREADFSQYDAVLHTAGIAHIKETSDNAALYYQINRDLTLEVAKAARAAGVKQFVFLSSVSVYGLEEGTITRETLPKPSSHYGRSKLQAEEGICQLQTDHFAVSILRPPMVYGEGCKGNYQTLVKIARKTPVFPDYWNQRSMVSIGTLCACMKEILDKEKTGVFFPQEREYICTCKMVQQIAGEYGRELRLVRWLNPAVVVAKHFSKRGRKAFGNLIYLHSSLDAGT